jgi:hypothetical protein
LIRDGNDDVLYFVIHSSINSLPLLSICLNGNDFPQNLIKNRSAILHYKNLNEILHTHLLCIEAQNPCPDKMNQVMFYSADHFRFLGIPDNLLTDPEQNFLFLPCTPRTPKVSALFQSEGLHPCPYNNHI